MTTVTSEVPAADGPANAGQQPAPGSRASRRASRPAPEGVDPRPSEHALNARASEDRPEVWGDAPARKQLSAHDESLKRDRPPHWG